MRELLKTLKPDAILLDKVMNILDPNDEGLVLSTQLADYIRNSEIYENLSHITLDV